MTGPLERRQVLAFDRVIKMQAWTSLLMVNPKGDAEANALLAFCRQLQITLVWDQAFLAPRAPASEHVRREAVLARLRTTAKANPRLGLLVGDPLTLASELAQEQVAGRLASFSGAILLQVADGQLLGPQLRAWAALVGPEGALLGKRPSEPARLAELQRAAPKWRHWQHGLWLVKAGDLQEIDVSVKRRAGAASADKGRTVTPPDAEVGVEVVAVAHPTNAGPPVPPPVPASASASVDAKPPAGPIRPPVLNLKRTRPVWETLDRNLRRA